MNSLFYPNIETAIMIPNDNDGSSYVKDSEPVIFSYKDEEIGKVFEEIISITTYTVNKFMSNGYTGERKILNVEIVTVGFILSLINPCKMRDFTLKLENYICSKFNIYASIFIRQCYDSPNNNICITIHSRRN